MKQKNIKRMNQIVVWFLFVAMVFTSQNMVMLATEFPEKDVRENNRKEHMQLGGRVISDYSARISLEDEYSGVITENGDLYCWDLHQ